MIQVHTVLRPTGNVAKAAEDFADTHFADSHLGYCLGGGRGHLPHITLIQADVENQSKADSIRQEIEKLSWDRDIELPMGAYYHECYGMPYCGVEVNDHQGLRDIHLNVCQIHEDFNATIHGMIRDDFWPHLTFAKTEKKLHKPELSDALRGHQSGWVLEFGYRGENGVYYGTQKPK